MRMEPSSVAMPEPTRAVTMTAANTGASFARQHDRDRHADVDLAVVDGRRVDGLDREDGAGEEGDQEHDRERADAHELIWSMRLRCGRAPHQPAEELADEVEVAPTDSSVRVKGRYSASTHTVQRAAAPPWRFGVGVVGHPRLARWPLAWRPDGAAS